MSMEIKKGLKRALIRIKNFTSIPFGLTQRHNHFKVSAIRQNGWFLIFILVFLILKSPVSYGQLDVNSGKEFPVRIAVRLIDMGTQKPIPYASIRILGTKRGVVADSNGFFTLVISQKDTLKISSLGFHDFYFVKDPSRQTSYFQVIQLRSKIFELNAVQITGKRTLDLENPMLRWEYKAKFLPKLWLFYTPTGGPPEAPTVMSPISFLYDKYSRRGKAARKLRDMVAERARRKFNSYRYNANKVQQWTGLLDDEIEEFMRFCPMPQAFLDEASEYEIIEKTFRCLEDFDNRQEKK